MPKKIPPFYENFDNTHCAQCVLRGIVEYFEPDQVWTWDEWDTFTGKVEGKGTWPQRGSINMMNRGYDLVNYSPIDIKEYLTMGIYDALVKFVGKEIADYAKRTSDFTQVKKDVEEYLAHPNLTSVLEQSTLEKLKHFLDRGYLISSYINARAMNGSEGFNGHLVLVYDIDETHVHLHDSGKPAHPERKMLIEDFVRACTTPNPDQWYFSAFKLKKDS